MRRLLGVCTLPQARARSRRLLDPLRRSDHEGRGIRSRLRCPGRRMEW
jgi:hypothetical protein